MAGSGPLFLIGRCEQPIQPLLSKIVFQHTNSCRLQLHFQFSEGNAEILRRAAPIGIKVISSTGSSVFTG